MQLKPWWQHHQRLWVTFDLADAQSKLEGETLVPAHYPTTRNVVNLARNFVLAARVMREFKPDLVVSNGAGVAVPFFVLARLFGIPTIYMEVYDRVNSRTLTGRLCRPFATKFLVQWPDQQRLYTNSTLVGPVY